MCVIDPKQYIGWLADIGHRYIVSSAYVLTDPRCNENFLLRDCNIEVIFIDYIGCEVCCFSSVKLQNTLPPFLTFKCLITIFEGSLQKMCANQPKCVNVTIFYPIISVTALALKVWRQSCSSMFRMIFGKNASFILTLIIFRETFLYICHIVM